MQKHAYMIIAHNEFDLLEILVRLLDDPRNDIYVHIDAKVKDFNFKSFQALTQYSGCGLRRAEYPRPGAIFR